MFSKRKNKYCCGWFSVNHQQPRTSDCIRVFKLNITLKNPGHLETFYAVGDTGKRRFVWHSDIPYRFYLMAPLKPPNLKYDKLFGGFLLSYCPFCGVNLFTFYGKERNIEDYVNEIEGETF
jgi:hypothetical protein